MATLIEEMVEFWKKLGTLIDSGIPLLQSLELVADEVTIKEVKEIIGKVKDDIRCGKIMSEALAILKNLCS